LQLVYTIDSELKPTGGGMERSMSLEDFDPEFASVRDYALFYRQIGLQAVPAMSPGRDLSKAWKRPALKDWRDYQNALVDDAKFDEWFPANYTGNIGVITGACSGYVFVVDLDFQKGPEAGLWLAEMDHRQQHAGELETVSQRTGGGGQQLFYRAPPGWIPPTGKNSELHVDIRGQGGFVMTAMSMHESGNRYQWIEGFEPWVVEIAEAPRWFCEELEKLFGQGTVEEAGATHSSAPKSKTTTPESALHPLGGIVDGRESYMARMIWAKVVDLYRTCPLKLSDSELAAIRDQLFLEYDLHCHSRIPPDGRPNADRLEQEGRGFSLFNEKWASAVAQWDGKVAKHAANPPQESLEPKGATIEGGDLAKSFELGVGDEDPLPLFPALPQSTPYPIEAMGCLAPAAAAIARKVQVPASTADQSVLAVAALAAQAHCDVVLPFGQRRPLSLYLATIAGSGDRKSSADNEACRPVAAREKSMRESHRNEKKKFEAERDAWNAEKKKLEGNKNIGFDEEADDLALLDAEPQPPLTPLLTMSDMTLDGLTRNWADGHASLAIFTAEGGTFTGGHGMSEENRLRTAATLSEVWDGKPIKRVRAKDGVTILPGRRLTLHVMIQPDASHGFVANAVLRDQGLLSRILVAAPESLAGGRFYRDPDPADDAEIRAFEMRILSILEAPAPLVDDRNELDPRELPMSMKAAALWKEFFNFVEGQSGPKGDLAGLRDLASKAAEHAARIAGVLTVFRDLNAAAIEAQEMQNAIDMMDWYLGEAARLQGAARLDPRLLRAQALLEWIRAQGPGEIKFRDILRLGPRAHQLRTKAAVEEAIAILKDHRQIDESPARPRAFTLRQEVKP
jgi:hypothetical protein